MYGPAIHEELARQRHADVVREARTDHLAATVKAEGQHETTLARFRARLAERRLRPAQPRLRPATRPS